jgi:hypothetical protein
LGKPMKRQQIDDMIAGYKSASEKSTNSAVATLAVPA